MTEPTNPQDQRGGELGLPKLVSKEATKQLGEQFGEVRDKTKVIDKKRNRIFRLGLGLGVYTGTVAGVLYVANNIFPED